MTHIKITEHIGPQEVNPFYGGFIKIVRYGKAYEVNRETTNVVTSPRMDDHAMLHISADRTRLLDLPLPATPESLRWLANFLNSAADHMDRDFVVPPETKPTPEPILLVEDDNGDTFYTGDLDAAKRLVAEERDVNKRVHADNHWTVDLVEKGTVDDVAEFGAGRTEEQAWRYALGAYFGPIDSEYDEVGLMRALARGTWTLGGDSDLALPPDVEVTATPRLTVGENGEPVVDLLDDPWAISQPDIEGLPGSGDDDYDEAVQQEHERGRQVTEPHTPGDYGNAVVPEPSTLPLVMCAADPHRNGNGKRYPHVQNKGCIKPTPVKGE